MKLPNLLILLSFSLIFCQIANAGNLPANPWAVKEPTPNSGNFPNASSSTDQTKSAVYSSGITDGEIMPVDPWARARDQSNVRTWRGSGQHGKLNYIGEATTFDSNNYGQEQLAPEVNRHNMKVMLDHLRNMGYKIPESYDQNISDIPSQYKEAWLRNYNKVQNKNDPLSRSFTGMMNTFENMTGLDIHNIITNTVDILGTD